MTKIPHLSLVDVLVRDVYSVAAVDIEPGAKEEIGDRDVKSIILFSFCGVLVRTVQGHDAV